MPEVVKVEKRVPLPTTAKTTRMTAAFKTMGIGDSFKLPKGINPSSPYAYANIAKIEITVRKQKDGYRVWRIA